MKFFRANIATIVLLSTLAASLMLNVALGWRLTSLSPAPRGGIKLDSSFSGLAIKALNGSKEILHFEGNKETIIYVLSPVCGWCKRNEANINTLADALSQRFRVIGLSIQDMPTKYDAYKFPVFVLRNEDDIQRLGLNGTPQTAILDSLGKVRKVWVGAYLPDIAREISEVFNVKLPGLIEIPASGRSSQIQ